MRSEGYGTWSVCLCVSVCLSVSTYHRTTPPPPPPQLPFVWPGHPPFIREVLVFNPRHGCAARVTVHGLFVCVCLSVCLYLPSHYPPRSPFVWPGHPLLYERCSFLTLGTDAQRELRYMVCLSVCVCLSVSTYHRTTPPPPPPPPPQLLTLASA